MSATADLSLTAGLEEGFYLWKKISLLAAKLMELACIASVCPPVTGCSITPKPLPLCVSRWASLKRQVNVS